MLSIKNLVVHYGHVQALKGISLEVEQGEIVSLIGANGAGKTTTLRAVSGLAKPTTGDIVFEGQNIAGLDAREIVIRGISHSPEGRQIFPRMTVLENLELGGYTRKDKHNFAGDYLQIYDYFPILAERRQQLAGTLSGGEQQMLAIGRALMAHPRLLLLDEPSLGLAPIFVEKIFDIIQAINTAGVTVLLIEQNAYQALQIAHRGYVLETGTVALSGQAADLLQNDHIRKAYLGA